MIIGHLSKDLQEQNWIALLLDFTVVVLGIFVGLQAADWNQSRLDRKEADYHVNFLHEELTEAKIAGAQKIEQVEIALRNSAQASMLLTAESWTPDEETRFREMVFSTFQLWGPTHRPVSLRRMMDGGKLELIDSKLLQKAILDYESAYLDAIEQTKTSHSYSLNITPKITSSMKFKGPEIISSKEELLANPILKAAVRDKAIWQRVQLDVLMDLQSAREELMAIIRAEDIL